MTTTLQKIYAKIFDNGTKKINAKRVRESFSLIDEKIGSVSSGFYGSINPSTPTPIEGWQKGFYSAEVSGTYNNAGGIVVNLNDGYTGLVFDGENWTSFVLPIDVNGIIPDWSDQETDLEFPKTRIFENYLYRVKPGQTATSADVPGISDKWEKLNEKVIDSNEFVYMLTDNNGNVLLALKSDGSLVNKSFNDVKATVDKLKTLSNVEEYDSEFLYTLKDVSGKILLAIKSDGSLVNKSFNHVKASVERLKTLTNVEELDPEFLYALKDISGKILLAIKSDGSLVNKSFNDVNASLSKLKILSNIEEDDFEYIQKVTDSKDNIISARKTDGRLIEKTIETNNLIINENIVFEKRSINNFIQTLKDADFNTSSGKSDKSDDQLAYLPFPKTISHINFDVLPTQLPIEKPTEVPLVFEYYDQYGNYLKKQGVISVQGTSSAGHLRKNFTLDITDGSKLKFGAMLESDSYYLKSFYTDSFRGQSVAMYQLYMDIINSRTIPHRKAFYAGYTAPSLATGTGKLLYDMSSGATYVANGFPIAFYCKGEFYGVYTLVQKKNRANYDMKKANAKEIWIDGVLDWRFFSNNIVWTDFELRNPAVKNMDGSDYNGDNPQEIQAGPTKTYIQNFATRIQSINAQSTDALKRTEFLKYFDLISTIDYFLFSNAIYNFDGFAKNWQWYTKDGTKWAIGLHDLDNIFGMSWRGNFILIDDIPTSMLGADGWMPTYFCTNIFLTETKARYNELKALKLLDANTITDRLKNWLDIITAPMLNADLAKWPETPSYRDSKTNKNYWVAVKMSPENLNGFNDWNASTAYAVGDKVKLVLADDTYGFRCIQLNTNQNPITGNYANYPFNLGFYNSIDRVRQTVVARLALLESTLGITN